MFEVPILDRAIIGSSRVRAAGRGRLSVKASRFHCLQRGGNGRPFAGRYALSMDEIEIRSSRCVQRAAPLGGKRRLPIDGCIVSIARFCDCKVWLAAATDEKGTGGENAPGKCYVFFGFETNADLATYLFSVSMGWWRGSPIGWSRLSFLLAADPGLDDLSPIQAFATDREAALELARNADIQGQRESPSAG